MTKQSIVDLSVMHSFTDGDLATEKELLGIFIQQSDINMQSLQEACIAGRGTSWVDAAHMLKSGAGGIGAEPLRILCENAELQVDVPLQARNLLFTQISDAYTRVKNHLIEAQLITI